MDFSELNTTYLISWIKLSPQFMLKSLTTQHGGRVGALKLKPNCRDLDSPFPMTELPTELYPLKHGGGFPLAPGIWHAQTARCNKVLHLVEIWCPTLWMHRLARVQYVYTCGRNMCVIYVWMNRSYVSLTSWWRVRWNPGKARPPMYTCAWADVLCANACVLKPGKTKSTSST